MSCDKQYIMAKLLTANLLFLKGSRLYTLFHLPYTYPVDLPEFTQSHSHFVGYITVKHEEMRPTLK